MHTNGSTTTSSNGHTSDAGSVRHSDLKDLLDEVAEAARVEEESSRALIEHNRATLDAHIRLGNAATDGNLAAYVNALNDIGLLRHEARRICEASIVQGSLANELFDRLRNVASRAVVTVTQAQS